MLSQRTFSLEEARALLPWLKEITRAAEIKLTTTRREAADPRKIQNRLQGIIQHWAETVFKLGAIPKQPFTVDFDSGRDYCWDYPEDNIVYRHGYHDGYMGRQRIEEKT